MPILTRWHYIQECSKHARKTKVVGWIAAAILVLSSIQSILPFVNVGFSIPRIPKIPLPWALVILLVAFLVIVTEGGFNRAKEKDAIHAKQVEALDQRLRHAIEEPNGPQIMVDVSPNVIFGETQLIVRSLAGGPSYGIQIQDAEYLSFLMKTEEIRYIPEGKFAICTLDIHPIDLPGYPCNLTGYLKVRPRGADEKYFSKIPLVATHTDANGSNGRKFRTCFEIQINHLTQKVEVKLISRTLVQS